MVQVIGYVKQKELVWFSKVGIKEKMIIPKQTAYSEHTTSILSVHKLKAYI